jgi:hypothetical protein
MYLGLVRRMNSRLQGSLCAPMVGSNISDVILGDALLSGEETLKQNSLIDKSGSDHPAGMTPNEVDGQVAGLKDLPYTMTQLLHVQSVRGAPVRGGAAVIPHFEYDVATHGWNCPRSSSVSRER